MLQRFTNVRVPLYAALLIAIVIGGVGVVAARYYRDTIENYELFLPASAGLEQQFAYGSWPALGQSDFYKSVRDTFVTQKATFIDADLTAKELRVFEDGVAVLTVPILATGRAGSWWETPAGLYRIDTKEERHYSSFSGVYMPWSMPFQGNFFIHGWPYYAGGSPVEPGYSGGCIRLRTEDAQQVYDRVVVGTPVLVFRSAAEPDTTRYSVHSPEILAKHYLIADLGSNFVLGERASKLEVPIASITKLVTALVATEYINLDTQITIQKSMIVPTSKPRLWVGQKLRAFDLMYPLLLESSNEAAEAFAQTVGSQRFVNLMNSKARALGLTHTHFADASGKSAENVSTAEDLFALLKYLYSNQSFFLKISSGRMNRELGPTPVWSGMENFNGFGNDPEFVGGKVGFSEAASSTIAAIFNATTARGPRPLVVIVLGSENGIADAALLKEHVKATYTPQE